jgi:hypothetical protein
MKRAGINGQMATRDLAHLTGIGLLTAEGTGRGRRYAASGAVEELRRETRAARPPITDPYPWMRPRLAEPTA